MTTWMDKPDGDGLWWRCCGGEVTLCVVRNNCYSFVIFNDGTACICGSAWGICEEQAKWLRCELTKPEPYVAPKPPVVKQYTAKNSDGSPIWITKVGAAFIAQNQKIESFRQYGAWVEIARIGYTDIKPLEDT